MKKPLVSTTVSTKARHLVSLLLLLGGWALAQTSDAALEANRQFLYDYNVLTTHGFISTPASSEQALEANRQFLYDYNVLTTHGFSGPTSLANDVPDRQFVMVALDLTEDHTGCLAVQLQVSLRDCLTAVYSARLVDAYTLGQLR